MKCVRYLTLSFVLLSVFSLPVFLPALAQESVQPAVIPTGYIDDLTPFVESSVSVYRDNSTITINMRAVDGNLDTQLYLVDSNGQIVAENDDMSDETFDSQIIYKNATIGDYRIIATRSGVANGATTGGYLLDFVINALPEVIEDYEVSSEVLEAAGYPETAPLPQAKWTVLAYYGGDSDLEAGILRDLNEFEQAGGSDENVRIVALIDRHVEYTAERGDWASTRLYEVRPNSNPDEETYEPLADLGDINTGSGEALAQFLAWGIRNYPAENYVLALASHGAGWEGIIVDNSPVNSIISLPQMQKALETAKNQTALESFALLINDACLMSSVEYFEAVKPYFARSYASPEVVINPALDMMQFAELLRQPDADLDSIGRQLVDTYILRDIQLRDLPTNAFMTHSVTNLDNFDGVTEAVEAFAAYFNSDPQRYSPMLGDARNNTYTYTSFALFDSQIDLGDFMDNVIDRTSDPEMATRAFAVKAALDEARVYGNGGAIGRLVSYYNIYFPRRSEDFTNRYFDDSPLIEWGRMLRSYYNVVTPRLWDDTSQRELSFHAPVAPTIRITGSYPQESSIYVPAIIEMEVTGRSIEQIGVTLDKVLENGDVQRLVNNTVRQTVDTGDGIEVINGWNPGVDTSRFVASPAAPAVTDGTSTGFEFLEVSDAAISLKGRYTSAENLNWRDITVLFNLDGTVQRVLSEDASSGALADVTVPVPAVFQAYRQIVSVDGQIREEPGNYYSWGEDELRIIGGQPLNAGEYDLGFKVSSFGGASDFDNIHIMVADNNAELNNMFTGYTNLELGFTALYPADWAGLDFTGEIIEGYSPDGNIWIGVHRVDYTPGTEPGIINAVNQFHARTNFRQTSDFTDVHVKGTPGVAYDIESNYGQNQWIGRNLVFAHPNRYGLIFQVMSPVSAGDAYLNVFKLLVENVFIIDRNSLTEIYDSVWLHDEIDIPDRRASYPIRREWRWNKEFDGFWYNYDPADNYSFIKVAHIADSDGDLQHLITEQLTAEVLYHDRAEILETDIYHAQNQEWEYQVYTYNLDNRQFIGRMYATREGENTYLVWMESRDTNYGRLIFNDIMEFTVDAFRVESNFQQYILVDAGVKLNYPQRWYIPWNLRTSDTAGYWTSAPVGKYEYFRVYYEQDIDSCTPQTAVDNFLASNPQHLLSELPVETDFDEAEALRFSSTYEWEAGRFNTWAIATCNADTAVVLMIEVSEDYETPEMLFEILQQSTFAEITEEDAVFRSIIDFG